MAKSIVNPANTTLAGSTTMNSMQATVTTLRTQLSKANQKLVDALNVHTTLKEKISSTKKQPQQIVEVDVMEMTTYVAHQLWSTPTTATHTEF